MENKQVWKFSVAGGLGRKLTITAPGPGKVVRVGPDGRGEPSLWIEVQPGSPHSFLELEIFGTGQAIPKACEHLGTWRDGLLIWHLYRHR